MRNNSVTSCQLPVTKRGFIMFDKNIPAPDTRQISERWNFHKMEKGDSILISGSEQDLKRAAAAARVHAHKSRARGDHKIFVTRSVGAGGIRVWRIE